MRPRSLFTNLRMTIVCLLCFCHLALAHTEPPKTADELQQREQARVTIAGQRVKLQHAWKFSRSLSTQPADSILWQTTHYDQRGNPVEQVLFDSLGVTRYLSKFGDRNVWLEELIYEGDSLSDRTVFVYLPDGVIHQILSFDNQGMLTGKLDYEYQSEAREIRVTKRTAGDSLLYTIVYAYAAGEEFRDNISSRQTNADGTLMVRVENRFEDHSRVSKTVFASDGSVNRVFSYRYTPSGEFAEIATMNADGKLISTQSFEYGPDGLLKQVVTHNENGQLTSLIHYHYEYFKDPLGNG